MAYQWCPNVQTEYVLFSGHLYMSNIWDTVYICSWHHHLLCFKRYPFLWNFFQWQKNPNETRANAFKSENNLQLIFWKIFSLLFRPLKQICSKTRCGSFCKNWAKKSRKKPFNKEWIMRKLFSEELTAACKCGFTPKPNQIRLFTP